MRSTSGRLALAVTLTTALTAPAWGQQASTPAAPSSTEAATWISEGDRLWATRAEGAKGAVAASAPIDAALAAYRKALALDKNSLDARWRAMRALYFKGEYATSDPAQARQIFDEGKNLGEEALVIVRRLSAASSGRSEESASPDELVPFVKGKPAILASFYWAAVDWGKWALLFGKTAAVKKGAAGKIRDYSKAVILLDPLFENGGGYRVLGRLHHQTPSIPFFTGWASRDAALQNLRLAVKVAPKDFINRLYLADATWDYDKPRRAEARALLEALVGDAPRSEFRVEDLKTQEEARELLAKWSAR